MVLPHHPQPWPYSQRSRNTKNNNIRFKRIFKRRISMRIWSFHSLLYSPFGKDLPRKLISLIFQQIFRVKIKIFLFFKHVNSSTFPDWGEGSGFSSLNFAETECPDMFVYGSTLGKHLENMLMIINKVTSRNLHTIICFCSVDFCAINKDRNWERREGGIHVLSIKIWGKYLRHVY